MMKPEGEALSTVAYKKSPIPVEVVETTEDLYYHFAWEMAWAIHLGATRGEYTTMILPIGPTGQYRRFAALCNRRRINCQHLVVIGMDEYLDEGGMQIPEEHPLSFRGLLRRELMDRLATDLRPPETQVVFPDPRRLEAVDDAIHQFGPVTVAFAGVGLNGHLAFNEPEPEMETEAFAALGTRIVRLRVETRITNAIAVAHGMLEAIPRRAVTIGMRQILAADRVSVYMHREWHPAVAQRLLYGPVSPAFPASLLRAHRNVGLVLTQEAAQTPEPRLR